MRELSCAVCHSNTYRVRYPERFRGDESLNFSARRDGRKQHPRIVECRRCGLIYSNPYFDNERLRLLYREAAYIDEQQLGNMSGDYLSEFISATAGLDHSACVLEIGCANGFFLERLYKAGYTNVYGIEPGKDAVAKASPLIREKILNEFFEPTRLQGKSFDVVCCFQIFDHIPDPNQFLRDVGSVLKPRGILLAINHDIRAPITRILREKSPMYDIEHIYLFDKRTIRRIFDANGFHVTYVEALRNSYTLDYGVKMFPFSPTLKSKLTHALRLVHLADVSVRVRAGNMVTVGRKRV